MIKKNLTTIFLCITFISTGAQAHQEKDYDRNGGHYDQSGYYHCHVASCELTESRYERRRNFLSSSDQSKYYLEEDWPHWNYAQGSCQNVRTMVLQSASLVPVTYTNPRQCEIREGLWVDEYTGEEFTRAGEMEIDHIIPPAYANGTNGYTWDDQTRESFANDPLNLIPVSRDTHRKKRDRGIGSWRPDRGFLCEYAMSWRDIADKYDLDLLARDRSRMMKILSDCEENESVEISN